MKCWLLDPHLHLWFYYLWDLWSRKFSLFIGIRNIFIKDIKVWECHLATRKVTNIYWINYSSSIYLNLTFYISTWQIEREHCFSNLQCLQRWSFVLTQTLLINIVKCKFIWVGKQWKSGIWIKMHGYSSS
jgi:hypothetical protein